MPAVRALAQSATVDIADIEARWSSANDDELRILVEQLAWRDMVSRPDDARRLLGTILSNRASPEAPGLQGEIYIGIARSHFADADYTDALSNLSIAIERFREEGNRDKEARAMVFRGDILNDTGDFVAAVTAYRNALRFADANTLPIVLEEAHSGLGALFHKLDLFEQANFHYQRALEAAVLQGRLPVGVATASAAMRAILGDQAEADQLMQEIRANLSETEDPNAIAIWHGAKGELALREKRWDEAFLEFKRASELYDGGRLVEGWFNCKKVLAQIELGEQTPSEPDLDECREHMKLVSGSDQTFRALAPAIALAKHDAQAGDYFSAYEQLLQSYQTHQSFYEDLNQDKTLVIMSGLGSDLNQQAVLLAEERAASAELRESRQRLWLILFCVVAVLLSVILAILYRTGRQSAAANRELAVQRQELSAALGTKELLLEELNHRVKNNLQVVASLLGLERRRAEREGRKADGFGDIQARVLSMASIHEGLQDAGSFDEVNLISYFERLAERFIAVYGVECAISLQTKDRPYIDIAAASPIGLIVGELVSNAHQHGYQSSSAGSILIGLEREGDRAILTVADEGRGLPDDFQLSTGANLGLSLVEDLAAQINAKISWERNPHGGVTWRLAIPGEMLTWDDKS